MKALSDVKAFEIVQRLQRKLPQKKYTIERLEDFQEVLCAEAPQMPVGSEKKISIYDPNATIFPSRYGMATLYCHQSFGGHDVIVDILSADKRYCMNVIQRYGPNEDRWTCSDMVQVMTSADSYNKQETDARVGTVGMCREFDSGELDATIWPSTGTFKGNKSCLYTILVTDGESDYPVTIDYKQLQMPDAPDEGSPNSSASYFAVPTYHSTNGAGRITLTIQQIRNLDNSKEVRFAILNPNSNQKLRRICGYY